MKTYKILLLITLIFGVAYFMLDRQLYFYGKNDFNFYNLLPLNIVPEDRPDFEGGFVLWDKYGISLVGKGVKYWNSDIKVGEIVKYSFNNQKLVAHIEDTTGNSYYIELSPNDNQLIKRDINVKVWNSDEVLKSEDFKRINIKGNEKKIKKIVLPRNYLMIAFIIMFIISLYKTIKSIKKKH